jgi:hypothetical protein
MADASMNLYIQNKMKADTAEEMNESSQSTYEYDLIYLFFKLLLFVVLGVVFFFLFKGQNPADILNNAKSATKAVTDKVVEKVANVKAAVKNKM